MTPPSSSPQDDWSDGFRLAEGETVEDVVALADDQARTTEKVVGALEDLGAPLPPTVDLVPWIPGGIVWTPRWVLLHLIEETARHAGHADIIRESIDGAHLLDAHGRGGGLAGAGLGVSGPCRRP